MSFPARHKIKYLYVHKHTAKSKTIDLALLTMSGDYVEYTLDFRKDCLTQHVIMRLRSVFSSFQLVPGSDVMFNTLLDIKHPFYQYLVLVRQHVQFKMSSISLLDAVKRVQDFLLKRVCKPQFMKAWKLAIDKKRCSWITQQIEWQMQRKGKTTASRLRQLRFILLYMDIKNYLYAIVSKSKAKKMNK